MSAPTRHHGYGVSAPALAHQWARQDGAPDGAAVVVDTEIAARLRGGVEWTAADSVTVSVIARPLLLNPSASELAWPAAALAGTDAVEALEAGTDIQCHWPDEVTATGSDRSVLRIAATAESVLGPGTVEYAVLTLRLAPVEGCGPSDRETVTAALVESLRRRSRQLNDLQELLDHYRRRCSTIGRLVSVRLLPHGSLRGRAVDVDENGALVVESPTGMRQRIAVNETGTVEVLDDAAQE